MSIHSRKKPTINERFLAYFGKGQWFNNSDIRMALGITTGQATVCIKNNKPDLIVDGSANRTFRYKFRRGEL